MLSFDPVQVAVLAAAATLLGCMLSCIPALHIYNILGLALWFGVRTGSGWLHSPHAVVCAVSMVVAFAMANTLPSILLGAPDESAVLTVLPGQKLMLRKQGLEAVLTTAAGGMVALLILALAIAPALVTSAPFVHDMLRPHAHWILWVVIVFMLMSEWPRGGNRHGTPLQRLADGWKSTGAGIITFLLSGLLGFVLFYKPPIHHTAAFQNLMPAFVGLFSIPWLIMNLYSRTVVPQQELTLKIPCGWRELLTGSISGLLGGLFAAYIPGATGGVGGMLAGHAAAQRNDHVFLSGQGSCKAVYYAAGFLFFMLPEVHITRGGSWMLKATYTPGAMTDLIMVQMSIVISACLSFLLMIPLGRYFCRYVGQHNYRRISAGALLLCTVLVIGLTGEAGLMIMLVASAIGFIPVLHHSRRLNALGIILLPIACNMSGIGIPIAGWLGLLK